MCKFLKVIHTVLTMADTFRIIPKYGYGIKISILYNNFVEVAVESVNAFANR